MSIEQKIDSTSVGGLVGIDNLVEFFHQLTLETIRPQLDEMVEKEWFPQVIKTATDAYIIAKERLCFQNIGYIFHKKRLLELAASLRSRGVSFYQSRGMLPSLAVLPELDVNIPWKVLRLICRGEYLCGKKVLGIESTEFRELIFECFACQKRFPEYAREIELFLDLLKCKELMDAAEENFVPILYTYNYWVSSQQGTEESAGAMKSFVDCMRTYFRRREQFSEELLHGAEIRKETGEEAQTLAHKTLVIDSILVSCVEKSLAQFQEKGAQEARIRKYSCLVARLHNCAKFLGIDEQRLLATCVGSSGCELRGPRLGKERDLYSPQIIQTLQQMDMRTLPSIEEFSQPLKEIEFSSFLDSFREEFLRGNVCRRQQVSAASANRSDFLPASLLKPQKQKMEMRGKLQSKKVAKPVKAPPTKKPLEADLVQESQVQSVETPALFAVPQETSPQEFHDEDHGVLESMSALPSGESRFVSVDDTVAVQPHTGSDPSLRYADHVARWFMEDRDIFNQDPSYKEKTYSKDLQDEIRFRHSFGLALVPVILQCGKQFMKKDPRTGQVRLSYTLPGEIIRHGRYEKAVFTVSVAKATGHVIHMYATNKTPLTIIQEYAREGWFPADDDEVDRMPCSSQRKYRSYALEDDGSRITEETDEFITVTQKDGTILTVYAFPYV